MVQCTCLYSRPLSSSEDSCPPGLFCKESHCECGKVYPKNLIHCNGTRSFVLKYACVTFNEDTQLTSIGVCNRGMNRTKSRGNLVSDTTYHLLPGNVSQLDDKMCRPVNRTGKLCGRCLPDHYPLVYSYNMNCILCPHARWNWLRYIMAAYLPLTLFYLLILHYHQPSLCCGVLLLVFDHANTVRACVCACVRACVRACVHACVRACVRACMRACMHACMHACMRACVRACVCVCVFGLREIIKNHKSKVGDDLCPSH